MKTFFKYFLALLIVWFASHLALIVIDGLTDENSKSAIANTMEEKH